MFATCLFRSPVLAALFLAVAAAGCNRTQSPSVSAPAAEGPKAEEDLARTTLAPEAVTSLGVQSRLVRNERVQERLQLPGWVMARQGHEVTVTAPVAGYVRGPRAADVAPVPGLPVRQGQELFLLEPVLSPVEQVQVAALRRGVESDWVKARDSLAAADKEQQRTEDLYRQKLRGEQDVEQARVRLGHAREDLAAAEDKRKLFADAADGSAPFRPVPVTAPRAGTVLSVPVSPGQYVPAAAALVTVADLSRPWVRVPVPEHDLANVDRTQPAAAVLGGAAGRRLELQPVALVPLVDPARRTADLIYELPAPGAEPLPPLARDQLVTVFVPAGGSREESVVPYAAVVFDAHGGSWVYLDLTADEAPQHVYERRRVELGPPVGDDVVVRPPLSGGERVVTAGAAALFSREFHKPPGPRPEKGKRDDDD